MLSVRFGRKNYRIGNTVNGESSLANADFIIVLIVRRSEEIAESSS